MFAAKRIEKIKEVMLEYKRVDISTLSSILSVSEATIRRDLEKLENEGFLKRSYGGAVLDEDMNVQPAPSRETTPNLDEKKMVGYIASQLVENNEAIIIGSGITCLQFAKHLKNKKNLTIVTNNVHIPSELSSNKEIKVVLTGGDVIYNDESMSMVGEFAHKMLEDIHVSKAFLGTGGVDIQFGFTSSNSDIAVMWNKMCRVANEVIILGDYTKFGKKNFIKLGPLNTAGKIVTNQEVPEEFKKYFFENGIPIYTSYELEK